MQDVFPGPHPNVACEGDACSPVTLHVAAVPEIFIYWPIPDRI